MKREQSDCTVQAELLFLSTKGRITMAPLASALMGRL